MRARAILLPSLVLLAAACRREAAPVAGAAQGTGTVRLTWTSPDTSYGPGAWEGAAQAGWCDSTRQLTVFAARGDTGVALLVSSRLGKGGTFPILAGADSATPEYALVAFRWFTGTRVVALTSQAGSVTLGTLTARLDGTLHAVAPTRVEDDSVVVDGTLAGIPVEVGAAGCRLAGAGVP